MYGFIGGVTLASTEAFEQFVFRYIQENRAAIWAGVGRLGFVERVDKLTSEIVV